MFQNKELDLNFSNHFISLYMTEIRRYIFISSIRVRVCVCVCVPDPVVWAGDRPQASGWQSSLCPSAVASWHLVIPPLCKLVLTKREERVNVLFISFISSSGAFHERRMYRQWEMNCMYKLLMTSVRYRSQSFIYTHISLSTHDSNHRPPG